MKETGARRMACYLPAEKVYTEPEESVKEGLGFYGRVL